MGGHDTVPVPSRVHAHGGSGEAGVSGGVLRHLAWSAGWARDVPRAGRPSEQRHEVQKVVVTSQHRSGAGSPVVWSGWCIRKGVPAVERYDTVTGERPPRRLAWWGQLCGFCKSPQGEARSYRMRYRWGNLPVRSVGRRVTGSSHGPAAGPAAREGGPRPLHRRTGTERKDLPARLALPGPAPPCMIQWGEGTSREDWSGLAPAGARRRHGHLHGWRRRRRSVIANDDCHGGFTAGPLLGNQQAGDCRQRPHARQGMEMVLRRRVTPPRLPATRQSRLRVDPSCC